LSSSQPPSPPDEDGDGDGGDGDRHRHRGRYYPYPFCCHHQLLPAADSAAAVQEHCRRCRIRGPVGGVVVDDNAVAADALEASPLLPSDAMDPTAAATTKTLDIDGDGGNGDGNGGGGNGDGDGNGNGGGDGNGNGNGNGNGDGNGNGNGNGGGVRRMQRRQPPMPPGRLPSLPGGRLLDRRDDGGRRGAAAVESGDCNDGNACDRHRCVVHWEGR